MFSVLCHDSKINSTLLQKDLDIVKEFCVKWKLALSRTQCTVMKFCPSTEVSTSYKIGNVSLPSVTSLKDLGVIVTNNLSWTPHIDKRCKRASYMLNKRTFSVLSTPTELKFIINAIKINLLLTIVEATPH